MERCIKCPVPKRRRIGGGRGMYGRLYATSSFYKAVCEEWVPPTLKHVYVFVVRGGIRSLV